jgi:hypothetical protein
MPIGIISASCVDLIFVSIGTRYDRQAVILVLCSGQCGIAGDGVCEMTQAPHNFVYCDATGEECFWPYCVVKDCALYALGRLKARYPVPAVVLNIGYVGVWPVTVTAP